jgi:hypothetical protein
MRKVTPGGMPMAKRIKKKISFHALPAFLTAYVLQLLQPKSRFTPTPARIFFRPTRISRFHQDFDGFELAVLWPIFIETGIKIKS